MATYGKSSKEDILNRIMSRIDGLYKRDSQMYKDARKNLSKLSRTALDQIFLMLSTTGPRS